MKNNFYRERMLWTESECKSDKKNSAQKLIRDKSHYSIVPNQTNLKATPFFDYKMLCTSSKRHSLTGQGFI